jgi:hypothetical protein
LAGFVLFACFAFRFFVYLFVLFRVRFLSSSVSLLDLNLNRHKNNGDLGNNKSLLTMSYL